MRKRYLEINEIYEICKTSKCIYCCIYVHILLSRGTGLKIHIRHKIAKMGPDPAILLLAFLSKLHENFRIRHNRRHGDQRKSKLAEEMLTQQEWRWD